MKYLKDALKFNLAFAIISLTCKFMSIIHKNIQDTDRQMVLFRTARMKAIESSCTDAYVNTSWCCCNNGSPLQWPTFETAAEINRLISQPLFLTGFQEIFTEFKNIDPVPSSATHIINSNRAHRTGAQLQIRLTPLQFWYLLINQRQKKFDQGFRHPYMETIDKQNIFVLWTALIYP